ncbi:hypothetical protein C8R43DRAFT_556689 [Mycena crocata]|nr:hypothetical protein C8R43DRAFT_556689 [Mycena crocata]
MSTLATNVIREDSAAGHAVDRAELAQIETQIRALEHSLLLLRLRKNVVEKRLGSYIYPVLTLPNEITSEIFLQFLPVYPNCPPSTGLLSPTVLTHICRSWREIALATPALWRALSLVFGSQDSDRSRTLLIPWMERSQPLPLSIRTDFLPTHSPQNRCIEPFISQRARWESLQLEKVGADWEVADSLVREPMPSLRHLALSFCRPPRFLLRLADAPLLRSLSLRYVFNAVVLPWAQLTHVTLFDICPDECAPILQQTLNLVHCELDLSFWFSTADDQLDIHILLPLLESLVIKPQPSHYVEEYLETSGFVVPSLRILHVSEALLGENPIQTLASFISKSGCLLKELLQPFLKCRSNRSWMNDYHALTTMSVSIRMVRLLPVGPAITYSRIVQEWKITINSMTILLSTYRFGSRRISSFLANRDQNVLLF